MKQHFRLDTHPVADAANVVQGEHYRITVLDAGLVRLEHSESGSFEDRASQTVREPRLRPAATSRSPRPTTRLEIHTDRLHLIYDKGPFTTHGLSVQAKGGYHSQRLGVALRGGLPNLGGTARTLDDVDGAIPLEDGVLAVQRRRDGRRLRDGAAPATTAGSPRGRRATSTSTCSPTAATTGAALRALYTLTGPTPLLPRYALGNWWSRYHPYTADEYVDLMDRFRAERVPLSVAVIDMDWHPVDIDPKYGSGWTGYTWNTELFPDPQQFLADLHERGPRDVAQRAPGRGGARARGGVRGDRGADGHRPGHRAAGRASTPPTRLRRGLPRGAAPPARGRGRRLLVAGLAAGRRHQGARASTRCGCSTTSTSSTPAATGSGR